MATQKFNNFESFLKMHADMTAVPIKSNKIVSSQVKDKWVLLVPSFREKNLLGQSNTLSINGLNSPIKSHRADKNTRPNYVLPMRLTSVLRKHRDWKWNDRKRYPMIMETKSKESSYSYVRQNRLMSTPQQVTRSLL